MRRILLQKRQDFCHGGQHHMSDPEAVQRLQKQLVTDNAKLGELRKREAKLLRSIPKKGFLAASERRQLLSEMQMLQGSIRENENRLAMAKH